MGGGGGGHGTPFSLPLSWRDGFGIGDFARLPAATTSELGMKFKQMVVGHTLTYPRCVPRWLFLNMALV